MTYPPPQGPPPQGPPPGEPADPNQPPSYGQPPYGQPSYGQPPSDQPSYGQPSGPPSYGQPSYGTTPYGQQPGYGGGSYGPPPDQGSWNYAQQPPPPPPGGRSNRVVIIAVVVAVLVVAGGITAAFALTGSSSSTQAGGSTSAGPSASAVSFPDVSPDASAGGSAGILPASPVTSDTAGTTVRSCKQPAGTTAAPDLAPSGVLTKLLGSGALLPTTSLVTPAVRYTTSTSSGTVDTYCYNNVMQSDLVGLVAFFGGAGYTQSNGKIPAQQQIFTSSNTLTPRLVALTVTGTLKISDSVFDPDTGSLEIDWQD